MAPPPDTSTALAESRRKAAASAVRMWGGITLGSVVLLVALVLWHMIRRGRLLRDNLSPPRVIPTLSPRDGEP